MISQKTSGEPVAAHLRQIVGNVGIVQVLLLLLAGGILWLVVDYARMLLLRRKMPPGPFPYPIIGNTFQLPDKKPWIYFETLAKTYNSPIITFWIGRNPTIWVNDAPTASDLLDKRAATFSSRPHMVVFGDLAFGQNSLVTMYYGDRFRVHRKLSHMGFGLQRVREYQGLQSDENKVVLKDLLTDGENYVSHFERYAASVVSIIGYGRRIRNTTDPIITEVIALMQRAAEHNVPGKSFPMLLETFPILAKFPRWAPWMRRFRQPRAKNFFFALAEEAANDGDKDCYSKKLFEQGPKYNLSEMELSTLSGNLFGAGSDTSSSTLITFVLACCAFPEALPKAWEELDRVVGPHRSPDFDDEANLVYVKAFVKEVFRWRSVAIIGGQPHAPIQDEIYKGWLIPKNTWVQGNVWAIHRNEREFPDPDRFDPERYLKDGANSRPFPNERGYMTFGWGRRVCAGQALAEQGTFISIARMLWAFKIRKALDKSGKEIPVDIFDYTDGLNIRPNPFKCRIAPRGEEIRKTIEREGKQAEENLSIYNGETKYRITTYRAEE
ncbi:probable cytochrome P450 CYP2 subfamily [Phialocephala subalpina]|uniref:Probable cytochrome P450 CYP2 subfamily n=1 Tax=Phialocephala subalpina TaxID=576137 RepID=A0A1L7XSP4_9HELO|nr:probable cytochrome P450 CYP2 subfamily [Phialocephala subalpina]